MELKDCLAAPQSQTEERGGVAREEVKAGVFHPALVESICASWGPLPSAEALAGHCPCPRQMGLALRGIPGRGVGDESEVAALLDLTIYTWFWISPSPWTAAVRPRRGEGK